jgi:hypothetical protein
VVAIVVQGAWGALLVLLGTFEQLFTAVIFTAWISYGAAVAGVIVLRRKQPGEVAARPGSGVSVAAGAVLPGGARHCHQRRRQPAAARRPGFPPPPGRPTRLQLPAPGRLSRGQGSTTITGSKAERGRCTHELLIRNL